MKKKIYIAGKVTGLPYDEVVSKFNLYREALLAQGYEVIVPLDLCGKDDDWKTAMRKCIAALCTCDEIDMLPDWKQSPGATMEHTIAVELGLAIRYIVNEYSYIVNEYSRPECAAIYCENPACCEENNHCRYQ